MKRILIQFMLAFLAILFQFSPVIAQVTVLHETFDDRDLTLNPVWSGDLDNFSFTEEDGNTLLRLDAEPDPNRTQIATLSSTTTGSWEFYFRQEFNSSNLNRAFIFLMADREELNYLDGSNVSGYAIRTGDNQSPRRLKLVRFDSGNQTVLSEAETELEEGAGYRVKVTRSDEGMWRLFISEGYKSEPAEDASPVTDLTYTSSSYFGLLLRYSAANTDGFYFDDFIIKNSEAFSLHQAKVVKANTVSLRFNYPLDPESVSPQSVNFTGLPAPVAAETDPSGMSAHFTFSDVIENGEYSVDVISIRNAFGDLLSGNTQVAFTFENPFYVAESEIETSRTIRILFSQEIASPSRERENFIINGEFNPNLIHPVSPKSIELEFNSDLPSGAVSIELWNIESVDGWKIANGTVLNAFRFGEDDSGSVVINEIMYRRAEANAPQFIELYNNTAHVFNLSDWRFDTDRGGTDLPSGLMIAENDYLVLTDHSEFSGLDDRIVYLPGFQPLRSTGDAVVLRNSSGIMVDSLYYLPEWGGNEPGISLERKDPAALSVDPVNWGGSEAEPGPTPLQQNTRYEQDVTPPVLEFSTYHQEEQLVLARFNEYVMKLPETKITIDGKNVKAVPVDDQPGAELLITSDTFSSGHEYFLEIDQLSDYQGNVSARMTLPITRHPKPGDLVFNEIMYDPLNDPHDGLPNQTEYLEIANRQNYALSLEGIYIYDQPDETGNVNMIEPETSRSAWIPAGGYALLHAENNDRRFTDSGNAQFFGLTDEMTPHVLRFARASLSLPSGGREVYLADSLDRMIDWVFYQPEWHNPNLIDTKGVSLERINPAGESNDQGNWGSNTMATGGTPGIKNSLHQIPAGVSSSNKISLEPKPFSPDDDGYEDNLLINYRFDEPDFMLRIRVFDRYGRLVRNLADSHPAGFDGSVIWDGRMDNGVTGRIGIYIVHIEAVNSMTGKKYQFKETAVLARQF